MVELKSKVIYGVLILALIIWTMPLRVGPIPFGEGDTAWHYSYSELTSEKGLLSELPDFLSFWVVEDYSNKYYGKSSLYYPPFFHSLAAVPMAFSADPIRTYFYFSVMLSALSILPIYILIKKMYDLGPALFASIIAVYVVRNFFSIYWGQHPSFVSFMILPLVIYSLYSFWNEQKKRYMFLFFGCLLLQYFIHPFALLVSLIFVILFVIALFIFKKKDLKKLCTKQNITLFVILALSSLVIALPFLKLYLGYSQGLYADVDFDFDIRTNDIPRWGFKDTGGYPSIFFDYSKLYLPGVLFLLIPGIFAIFKERKLRDMTLVLWALTLYIAARLHFLGVSPYGLSLRVFYAEGALFASIAAVGAFFVINKVKDTNIKSLLRSGLFIALIVILLIKTPMLNLVYPYEYRLNEGEVQAARWMKDNLPENAKVYSLGPIVYPKEIWLNVISHRIVFPREHQEEMNVTHMYIDYSDMIYMGDRAGYQYIKDAETALLNSTLGLPSEQKIHALEKMYALDNIFIYKVELIK